MIITENGSVTDSKGFRLLYDVTDEDIDFCVSGVDFKTAKLIASAPETKRQRDALLDFAKMMVDNKYEPDKLLCQIERFGVKAIALTKEATDGS